MTGLDNHCHPSKCCICAMERMCLSREEDGFILAHRGEIIHRLLYDTVYYQTYEIELMRKTLIQMDQESKENKGKENMGNLMNDYELTQWMKGEIEKARKEGLEEAWEIARKLGLNHDRGGYCSDEIKSIFDKRWIEVFTDMSIHEVKEKIAAYEAEQAKPKLGDVVIIKPVDDECRSFNGIYLGTNIDGHYILENDGGLPTFLLNRDAWIIEKTGKHFDIQSMLDDLN